MKYKAVLFDLDDTLVKTAHIKWAHHKEVAKQFYNIELTDEILAQHWGLPYHDLIQILYQNRDTLENMLKAKDSLEQHYLKTLQDDAIQTVHTLLARDIEVGIITSALSHHAQVDLQRLGFPLERFFILQGADDAPFHKPDPKVFDASIQLLSAKNIQPRETLYVGDALMDYHAAHGVHFDFMGVTTGLVSAHQFAMVGARSAPSLSDILHSFLPTLI